MIAPVDSTRKVHLKKWGKTSRKTATLTDETGWNIHVLKEIDGATNTSEHTMLHKLRGFHSFQIQIVLYRQAAPKPLTHYSPMEVALHFLGHSQNPPRPQRKHHVITLPENRYQRSTIRLCGGTLILGATKVLQCKALTFTNYWVILRMVAGGWMQMMQLAVATFVDL